MAKRKLKRTTNLDGVTYYPGDEVDDEVFTNPKLFKDPEPGHPDYDGDLVEQVDDGSDDGEDTKPAKKAAPAKKSAPSSK